MAVISIKNKIKSGSLLVGNTPYEPGDFESIQTVTVASGGSSTITFSSIPSTYQHLQLRVFGQTNRGTYGRDAFVLRFNSDSGANYSFHYLVGDGGTPGSSGDPNETKIITPEVTTTTAGASIFGGFVTDILDYANTSKYKTVRMIGGGDHNGTVASLGAQTSLRSGSWRSTSAVSTITLTPSIGTSISQYSHFALYGMKG